MKMMFRIAAPVMALMATPSFAATLADGSFEAQGADALAGTGASYCYFEAAAGAPTTCNNAGQPFGGASGLIASGSGPWGGTPADDGDYYSFVQSSGTLTQTFTAGSTGTYQLLWSDRQRSNNGGAQTYTVSISPADVAARGGVLPPVELGTFTASDPNAWTNRTGSTNFMLAADTSYTLTFTGLTTGDNTAFIDAVSIAGVPETSTWAMMILGLGAIGGSLRRRRKPGALAIA